MKNLLTILCCVGALFFVGCDSDNDPATPADGAPADNTPGDGSETTPTKHTVTTTNESMDFMPADLTIAVGDIVTFEMTATHNAIEVSKETYDDTNVTPLEGGFRVEFGETLDVTFDTAGTFYYVCQPHVKMGMIGTITVE